MRCFHRSKERCSEWNIYWLAMQHRSCWLVRIVSCSVRNKVVADMFLSIFLVLPSQPARVRRSWTKTCQNDVTGDAAPKFMLLLPLEWFINDISVFHSAILTIHNRDVTLGYVPTVKFGIGDDSRYHRDRCFACSFTIWLCFCACLSSSLCLTTVKTTQARHFSCSFFVKWKMHEKSRPVHP